MGQIYVIVLDATSETVRKTTGMCRQPTSFIRSVKQCTRQ